MSVFGTIKQPLYDEFQKEIFRSASYGRLWEPVRPMLGNIGPGETELCLRLRWTLLHGVDNGPVLRGLWSLANGEELYR